MAAAALLVGLIGGLPHLLIGARLKAEGKQYAPLVVRDVSPLTYDETTGYAPAVREVLDGHAFSADPFTWDHKRGAPFLGDHLVERLVTGAMAFFLGRSVPNVFIFCDFVLPPIAFLLLFAICRRFGAPNWVAIAAAMLALIARMPEATRPLDFTRLPAPEFSSILCLGAILCLLALYEQPRPRRAALAALLIAAVSYSDTHYWTPVLIGGLGLLLASALAPGRRRAARMLAVALGAAVLIAAPVILQIAVEGLNVALASSPVAQASSLRTLLLLLLILLLYPKRRRESIPIIAFLAAPLICILGGQIAGHGMQDDQWLALAWSALALVMMLWAWLQILAKRLAARAPEDAPESPALARRAHIGLSIAFGALAGLVILYAAHAQWRFSTDMPERYTLPAATRQALTELHLRAPRDSVVVTLDPDALALIPVYTHCNVFLPRATSPISTEELLDRAAMTFAAYGVTDPNVAKLLSSRDHETSETPAQNLSTLPNWLFPREPLSRSAPAEHEAQIRAKAKFHGPHAIAQNADKHRADLIWWGPRERRLGKRHIEQEMADRIFLDAGEVKVYRLRSPVE